MLTVRPRHRQGGLRRPIARPATAQGGGAPRAIPNLNDDQWIWGGTLDQIYQTIQHGIR